MKSVKFVAVSIVASMFVSAAAMAAVPAVTTIPGTPGEPQLSPEQSYRVAQIVNACLVATKTSTLFNQVHVNQAQIRPGCENYIRFDARSGIGALNLGNEVLQFKVTISGGMDADENQVQFAENGKIIASYWLTDDSVENGLAVLKARL